MKAASGYLIALLTTGRFWKCDLVTITLANGTVARYSTGDLDVTIGGHTYSSTGTRMECSKQHWKIGLDVDSLELKVNPLATDLVGGVPFAAAVVEGAFDGATVQLDRLYGAFPGDIAAGVLPLFAGRIGDIVGGRNGFKFAINTHLELLNQQMPKNLYQPKCVHALYDAGCQAVKATFTFTGAVAASPGLTALTVTGAAAAKPDGYFTLGQLIFTSGPNNGLTRSVKSWAAGVVTVMPPLDLLPILADTLTLTAGCDKQQLTCVSKFSNAANFRGFPYIPVPETAF